LDALVCLAYKGAKKGFMVPGLGKLVLVIAKARMAAIQPPAKRSRFRRRSREVPRGEGRQGCGSESEVKLLAVDTKRPRHIGAAAFFSLCARQGAPA